MKGQVARGAMWIAATRVLVNLIGVASTILLARLLFPADFGIVAIATTVMAIVSAMTEISLSSALVQHRDPDDAHYDTAFTLNLARAVIVAAVTAALAWPMAALYRDARLVDLILVLAAISGLVGLGNPKLVVLWRSMKFHQEFIIGVLQKLVGFVAAVVVALVYRSYWALVVGSAVSQLVAVAVSYMFVRYRPRLSLAKAGELMSFSIWVSFSQIVSTLNYRFDNLIIGYFLDKSAVGFYSYGDNLASMATREVTTPVANTLFSAFARMTDDPDRLRRAYFRSQSLLFALAMPVGCGFAMIAEPLVLAALGAKWRAAIPVIEVIATVTAVQTLGMTHYALAMATGNTRALFRRDLVNLGFRLPIVMTGLALAGLAGVLAARVVAGTIALILNMALIRRLIGVPLHDQCAANVRPPIATAAMALAIWAWRLALPLPVGWRPQVATIAATIVLGGLVYVGTTALAWLAMGKPDGVEREVLTIAGERFRPRRAI